MSQVTAWGDGPSDLQATKAHTLDWTCFPRELVLCCPVAFLYLSQPSLVSTRSATEEISMHTTCLAISCETKLDGHLVNPG
jgi:hypothetical protein